VKNRKIFFALLAVLALTFPTAAFPFYVPAGSGIKGLGRANVQAIESEFSAMEQAALLFRTEDPAGANNLQEGVNYAADLSNYTDVPGRYTDTERYGLLVDSRGWWLGVAVPKADSMREYVAQSAPGKAWFGSRDTSTPPGKAAFQAKDEIVWKLFR